jgi:hypothetical protein
MCDVREETSIHDAIRLGMSALMAPVDVHDIDWNDLIKNNGANSDAWIPDVFEMANHAMEHFRDAASKALKLGV